MTELKVLVPANGRDCPICLKSFTNFDVVTVLDCGHLICTTCNDEYKKNCDARFHFSRASFIMDINHMDDVTKRIFGIPIDWTPVRVIDTAAEGGPLCYGVYDALNELHDDDDDWNIHVTRSVFLDICKGVYKCPTCREYSYYTVEAYAALYYKGTLDDPIVVDDKCYKGDGTNEDPIDVDGVTVTW